MKRVLIAAGLVLAVALVVTNFAAADPLKSGPQVGQEVPGPFHPLNVTGPKAGQKNCLYCQNGSNPVAMIFARDVSEPVTKLIKKVDEATAQHGDCQMGSFVVFLSDAEDLQAKRGRSWAYNEPNSQSGYGIIRHHLLQIDETLGFFGSIVEAGWHERSIHLVRSGQVNASAIDSHVLAVAMRDDPGLAAD